MNEAIFPIILTVVILVLTAVIIAISFGAVFYFYYAKRKRLQHLVENGVKGTAVIKTLSETGLIINNVPQIAMTLEVTAENIPPYTIVKRTEIPMIYYPRIQPGMTIDVMVDPARLNDQKYIGLLFA